MPKKKLSTDDALALVLSGLKGDNHSLKFMPKIWSIHRNLLQA